MKTRQQAEREEQQRIKSLVLNYDQSREIDDQDGEAPSPILCPNANIYNVSSSGYDSKPATYHHNRPAAGKERGTPRARQLQVKDFEWYDKSRCSNQQSGNPGRVNVRERSESQDPEDKENVDMSVVPVNKRIMEPSHLPSRGRRRRGLRT